MTDPLITLTTDFGYNDSYTGVMKGVINSINPSAKMIDITHNIPSQNLFSVNYVIESAYKYFRKNTIHVIIVDPGVGTSRLPIIVKTENYYFITPDNGTLTLISETEKILSVNLIENNEYTLKDISKTFHGRDIFAPAAAHLSINNNPGDFGKKINSIVRIKELQPFIKNNLIYGIIIHKDHFGNLITNLKSSILTDMKVNRFNLKINNHCIKEYVETFADLKKNETGFYSGSSGYIEIGSNCGNAAELLKAETGMRFILEIN